ncbi:MAG TPA: hypothetical protein VKZ42_01605, partial [Flavobacteriaceae bacterium]|nr:hypothetical protein [Flavobacteriaceae bacterium]
MKISIPSFFKSIAVVTVVLFFSSFQSEVVAQNYFVYDGDTFSVMLTSNSANTRITKVEFSDNNRWNEFKIIDFEDLEDTEEGGFTYTVKDGKGKIFFIDYYRDL